MFYARLLTLLCGLFALTGGLADLSAQEKGKKDDPVKKDEPAGKVKGQLPQGWGKIGLTDEQKQKVYKIHAKYNDQIDKLEAQIKELKEKRDHERYDVLTAEQKKRLKEAGEPKGSKGDKDK
jgi:Spy/CpxP family protein refolding chaperone